MNTTPPKSVLPKSANLEWLKKAAKQRLRSWQAEGRSDKLADAQLSLAREYGFSSWRALRAHVIQFSGLQLDGNKDIEHFLRLVGKGELDQVRVLISEKPSLINETGPHPFWGGRPQALHVAVETKRPEMVELLLENGAGINGQNDGYEYWSPLMLSYWMENLEIRNLLIEHGAHVGLLEALLGGDDVLVDKFLQGGKNAIPKKRPKGLLNLARTPFAIDQLLELGFSPNEPDRWGTPAVESFSRLGPQGRMLLEHLKTHNIFPKPEEYARMGDMAALQNMYLTSADQVIADEVFMGAVDFGHYDLVRWLLAAGANVNANAAKGSQGSALHSACWNGDLEMVKLLIEHSADVEARDPEHNNTPQGWAEVAREVTNNPECDEVVAFLRAVTNPPT